MLRKNDKEGKRFEFSVANVIAIVLFAATVFIVSTWFWYGLGSFIGSITK
jgi:hypothetical protein